MKKRTRQLMALFVIFTLIVGLVPAPGVSYALGEDAPGQTEAQPDPTETQPDPTETQPGQDGQAENDGKSGNDGQPGQPEAQADQPGQPGQPGAQSEATDEAADESAIEEAKEGEDGAMLRAEADPDPKSGDVDDIIASMTLDEKISQMIIPAFRTWDGTNVTSLAEGSVLAKALRKHQYGGVILYSNNVKSVDQTAALINALQANNFQYVRNGAGETPAHIPYFTCVDEEGGVVLRFTMGTRMNGSMAVGATGIASGLAAGYAYETGRVLGEECAALGFNVNFAPSIDVNSNPANPVIGTRAFSDDPQAVGVLGNKYVEGMNATGTIATLKHFPGHGDAGNDTHIGTATVTKTKEQLEACELVPFKAAIAQDTDMIMTAHITLPNYDNYEVFADGTNGYFPATMSYKVMTSLLRGELGYDGVIVTDALEMGAVSSGPLVPGAANSVEYCANVAEKVINAGCDILLLPRDLKDADAATFYDEYITALVNKVGDGANNSIKVARIDQSVRRILNLKKKYGFLTEYKTVDAGVAAATVGAAAHHATEKEIAQKAITLLKNDALTLPISGHNGNIVLLGRLEGDMKTITYAVQDLQKQGLIAEDAYVQNLATGTTSGSADSTCHIAIDYYCGFDDAGKAVSHYTDELKAAIAQAGTVACFTASSSTSPLAATSPLYQSVSRAMEETHEAGGRFVLMANNLPYDAARYQGADAILLSYMTAGTNSDPTEISSGTVAYNANVIAAVETLFDNMPPEGTVPVNIPTVTENEDGTISFGSDVLYKRGEGLAYTYAFVEGAGGKYQKGSSADLRFKNNARYDKLTKVLVDDNALEEGQYETSVGSTNVTLKGDYLEKLDDGDHKLSTVYDYGSGEFNVDTTFSVTQKSTPKPTDTKTTKTTTQTTTKTKTPATGDALPSVGAVLALGIVALITAVLARRRQC